MKVCDSINKRLCIYLPIVKAEKFFDEMQKNTW